MKYSICETIKRYHEIEISDELEIIDNSLGIEKIIEYANVICHRYENAKEAIAFILDKYKNKYGFDYTIDLEAEGSEIVNIEVIEQID